MQRVSSLHSSFHWLTLVLFFISATGTSAAFFASFNVAQAANLEAAMATTPTFSCPANLLLNPSFETLLPNSSKPANWSGGANTATSSGIIKPDGVRYGYNSASNSKPMTQTVSAQVGSSYSLTFYSASHKPGVQTITLQYLTATDEATGSAQVHTIAKDIDIDGHFGGPYALSLAAAPANAAKVRVSVSANGIDWAKVDALCLQAVATTPTATATNTATPVPPTVTPTNTATVAAPICTGNLISNPGFENDSVNASPLNWSGAGKVGGEYSGFNTQDGVKFAYVTGNQSMWVSLLTTAGKSYQVTFYSGSHVPNPSQQVRLTFYNSSFVTLAQSSHTIVADMETLGQFGGPYTLNIGPAPVNTTELRFEVSDGGNNYAKIDGVCLRETTPPTATPTNTNVPPTATPTNTNVPPTATPTNTNVPPTATPTNTNVPPTATPTNTNVPPTATPTNTNVPPTATPTNTKVPPTATPTNTKVPPTATPTNTNVPPTATPTNTNVPPTATPTNTNVPPTATPTNTNVPPTATPTNTNIPPTATPTNTKVPPTATPTNTNVPPTATPTNTPLPQLGSLGNQVWYDVKGTANQDEGVTYVPGVYVSLLQSCSGSVVLATQITDNNGYYNFDNLSAGQYRVYFSNLPVGYQFTGKDQGSSERTDSDANSAGMTDCITLAAGENNPNVDAGIMIIPQPTATATNTPVLPTATPTNTPVPPTATPTNTPVLGKIGNYVWLDSNADGHQDASEKGIANVIVSMIDATGKVVTTKTDGNGGYLFANLPQGIYTVKIVDENFTNTGMLTKLMQTPLTGGDADFGNKDDAGYTIDLSWGDLSWGEENLSADFGYIQSACLGDRVWEDANRNGKQDATEANVPNITVELLGNNGSVITTTVTDGTGNYLFCNLLPGDYSLHFSHPVKYTPTLNNRGSDDGMDSDVDPLNFHTALTSLSAGEDDRSWDYGIYRSGVVESPEFLAALGNLVWEDENRDGSQSIGEEGIFNVTVKLYNEQNQLISSTTTSETGYYWFYNLAPGSYLVEFVPPVGYHMTDSNVGDDTLDSDALVESNRTPIVVLVAGDLNQTLDAGFYLVPTAVDESNEPLTGRVFLPIVTR